MRKMLCLIGRPGTGKTSLMRKFLENYDWEKKELVKLVNSLYNEKNDLHVLGKYEEGEVFAGTDKLSMSVLPEVRKFVDEVNSNIFFEGDRLTSGSFFEWLSDKSDIDLKIIVLQVPEKVLLERYKERGSEQSDQFLQGRKTKLNNIGTNMSLMDIIEYRDNSTLEQQQKILTEIKEFLIGD